MASSQMTPGYLATAR